MRPLVLCVLALLLFPACDTGGGDNEGPALGRFSATFTGDVDGSFEGQAGFTVTAIPDGEPSLGVTMLIPGSLSLRSLGIVDPRGAIDGEGRYTLDTDGERSIGMVYFDFGGDLTLIAVSGEVVVTRFEADRIDGTFSAQLRESLQESGAGARVQGSFSARLIPTPGR